MAKYVMDADLREQWLKDLRSGNFRQGQATLARRRTDKKYEYCCLGVLGQRCGLLKSPGKGEGNCKHVKGTNKPISGYLKDSMGTALKFRGRNILSVNAQKELAGLNDAGHPFREIADWIEKNIKGREPKAEKKAA